MPTNVTKKPRSPTISKVLLRKQSQGDPPYCNTITRWNPKNDPCAFSFAPEDHRQDKAQRRASQVNGAPGECQPKTF